MADDNESCIAKYMDYSLNCLVPDEFEAISYKNNPLLFILCVADTIEPSKRFSQYSNEEILSLISIDYNKNTNILDIEIAEKLYNCPECLKYRSDILELSKWCDITTNCISKAL